MGSVQRISITFGVRRERRTRVVEISVGFRQTDRSLLYNAISHDASHMPINMYRLILSVVLPESL